MKKLLRFLPSLTMKFIDTNYSFNGNLVKRAKFHLVLLFVLAASFAQGTVGITAATGGTNISVDKAANATSPAYTTLGNIVITEGNKADFSASASGATITISAPAGFAFNPGVGTVSSTSPGDITSSSINVTAGSIVITYSSNNANKLDVMTISGIQVRPTDGANIAASGNLVFSALSTPITGITAGTTTAGALSVVIGALNKLVVTLPGQTFTDGTTLAGSGNSGTVTAQTAGTSFNISSLTATDQFFNVITSYTGTKTISYTGPGSALTAPAYTTSVSFTNGISTTVLATTLKKAETTTITASDGTISGASSSLAVNSAALDHFSISTISSPQTAGTAFSATITAQDVNNNTVTSFTSTAAMTTNAGTITPSTSNAFTAGVLTQSFTVTQSGSSKTITVTAGGKTATSNTFTVNAGALDHFAFNTISSPQTAGTAFSATITAQDVNNNTVTSFTSTAVMTTNAGTITPSTSNAFTAGVLTQNFTVTQAGSLKTITATAAGKTGTSNTFTVNPGTLDHFSISTISSPQTAGTPFSATITAQDVNNNTVTSFASSVTMSSNLATISPTTSNAFTAGVLTQNFTVTPGASGVIITATFTTKSGLSNSFIVNNPSPTITSISSTSVCSGSTGFTLTVNGTNFNSSSVVQFNSAIKTTTFVSATQLTINVSTGDLVTAGVYPIKVSNPSPGGGLSGSLNLTVVGAAAANAGSAVSTCSSAGARTITALSSAANYTGVMWSTSDGTGTFTNPTSLTTAAYTPSAADKAAGSVTLVLTATGNSPCGNATSTKTLTIIPAATANAGTALAPSCNNGNAIIIATGSSATNYSSIEWTSNGTGVITNPNSLTNAAYTPGVGETGSITLTLTATGNGICGAVTSSKTLNVKGITATYDKLFASFCGNNDDGAIDLTVNGTAPYTFSWTGQGGFTSSNEDISGLAIGDYSVTITDASNCALTLPNLSIKKLSAPSINVLKVTPPSSTCVGTDASIRVNLANAYNDNITPIQFSLSGTITRGFQTSGYFGNLTPGSYTVTGKDSKGCTAASSTILINPPAASTLAFRNTGSTTNVSSCGGGDDGTITSVVTGGVAPYHFILDGVEKKVTYLQYFTFTGLQANVSYNITVTDSKQCDAISQDITLQQATAPVAILAHKGNETCIGAADGFIALGGGGGLKPYAFSINNGTTFQSSNGFFNLSPGTYNVKVKDAKGCISEAVTVTINSGTATCPGGRSSGNLITQASVKNSKITNPVINSTLSLQAFPVPFATGFSLDVKGNSRQKVSLIITDILGRKLYETRGNANQQYRLGNTLNKGIYFVQARQGNNIQTIKVTKE